MDARKIDRRLGLADSKLGLLARYLARDFAVIKGTLEKCGRLEITTSVESSTTGGVVGRYSDGSFGALSHSKTTESVNVSRTISVVKIGSTILTDVWIPTTAFVDSIKLGENIGVVISRNKAEMWLIKNYADDSTIGSQPSMFGKIVAKWLGIFIACNGIYFFLISLLGADVLGYSQLAIIIGFVVYRSCEIAMREEFSSWNQALEDLKVP